MPNTEKFELIRSTGKLSGKEYGTSENMANWPWIRTGKNRLTTYAQVLNNGTDPVEELRKKCPSLGGIDIIWEKSNSFQDSAKKIFTICTGVVEVPDDVDILTLLD